MTINFSLICQIRDFGSGQILQPRQCYLSPGLAKIAPWWLARRDHFSPKVPGLVSADGATNVYSLNRRAVSCKANRKLALYQDFRRTSKSFAARPCNRPFAAKHMLFCLPWLRRLYNLSWHINPARYRDLASLTTSSYHDNSCRLSGLCHLDNFIITWQFLTIQFTVILIF
jgi:hypothetical protein